MKLHHLRPAPGATKKRKRVGRGIAAGQGKTAGRGTKGLLARNQSKLGFEGGQMPLARRVPKLKGFKNRNREEFQVVNLSRLSEVFDPGASVTPDVLVERGLVRKGRPVKVLGQGDVDRALAVEAHAFSGTARDKIERAGGSVRVL